jgi:hypothetical protein
MPQIIVTAHDDETTVTMRERVNASDFESERFAANLVERLDWAVRDAVEVEYAKPPAPEPGRERPARERERPITGQRKRASAKRKPEQDRQLDPAGIA